MLLEPVSDQENLEQADYLPAEVLDPWQELDNPDGVHTSQNDCALSQIGMLHAAQQRRLQLEDAPGTRILVESSDVCCQKVERSDGQSLSTSSSGRRRHGQNS